MMGMMPFERITKKAVDPFYLATMPGEVKDPTPIQRRLAYL